MDKATCQKCGEQMYSITPEKDYWVCHCGAVFCCDAETPREVRRIILKAAKENGGQSIRVKSKKCGSKSSGGGKDKKAKMQRPSTTGLYNKLAASENAKPYKIL